MNSLLNSLAAYIRLLRDRIHKEEHRFFPVARQAFSGDELEALSELFRREHEKRGERAFRENQELVQEMADFLS